MALLTLMRVLTLANPTAVVTGILLTRHLLGFLTRRERRRLTEAGEPGRRGRRALRLALV